MFPRRRDAKRYVFPIGSLWESVGIDKDSSVRGYRHQTSRYARFKVALDVAAAVYLALVVVALLVDQFVVGRVLTEMSPAGRKLIWTSHSSFMATFAHLFTLQPLLLRVGAETFSTHRRELFIFILLVLAILLHESYWLKRNILLNGTPSGYEGFLSSEKSTEKARDTWTLISSIVNHVFLIGVLLTGASFLWDARLLPIINHPVAERRILFAGVFLTVIGAFNVIKALEKREEPRSLGWLNAIAEAIVSGIAFGTIVTVGLQRGLQPGKLAFVFGFVFVLTMWIISYFIVRPTQTEQPMDISRRRLKTRSQRLLHYCVQVPLIALGWAVNPTLIAIEYVAVRIQRVLAKLAGWIYYRAKWIEPYSLRMWLWRIAEVETIARENDKGARQFKAIEIVSQSERGIGAFDVGPPPPLAVGGFDQYVRRRYLHRILEGDSWLTRWVKREPARPVTTHYGGGWDREDPLDFQRNVRHVVTNWPTYAENAELYRHLIALMVAVSFVAYFVNIVVGHVVAAYGRPLFDKGSGYAALFGLMVGALFAVVTMMGKSSLSSLALGLVSGLVLAPSLGVAEGLRDRLANEGVDLLIGFVVTLLTNMLGERRLLATGVLIFLLGLYLQTLPHLSR